MERMEREDADEPFGLQGFGRVSFVGSPVFAKGSVFFGNGKSHILIENYLGGDSST